MAPAPEAGVLKSAFDRWTTSGRDRTIPVDLIMPRMGIYMPNMGMKAKRHVSKATKCAGPAELP
jgi:hypothetical protein